MHKLREALTATQGENEIGGTVETDGAYFGGYVKPANVKAERKRRRLKAYQTGKRQVVVVAREREGQTATMVGKSEAEGVAFIMGRVQPGAALAHPVSRQWKGYWQRTAG